MDPGEDPMQKDGVDFGETTVDPGEGENAEYQRVGPLIPWT